MAGLLFDGFDHSITMAKLELRARATGIGKGSLEGGGPLLVFLDEEEGDGMLSVAGEV